LVRVVKQLYASLSQAAQDGSIGADALMNLGRRTNEYFTLFTATWLRSDAIASHFVFELGGFEFLLDTIGKRDESSAGDKHEPAPVSRPEPKQLASAGQPSRPELESDIFDLLEAGEEEATAGADGQAGTAPTETQPPA